MHEITISNLQRQIGIVQDLALKEPVSITRNGREKYVFLSSEEYQRLKRLDHASDQKAEPETPEEYQYLDKFLQEDEQRWQNYLATGEIVTAHDVRKKLQTLAAQAAQKLSR